MEIDLTDRDKKFKIWEVVSHWEGPYRISRSAPGNAYILETLEGVEFPRALNGKYLKKYYPSIWVDAKELSADNIPIGWVKMYLRITFSVLKGADNSLIG